MRPKISYFLPYVGAVIAICVVPAPTFAQDLRLWATQYYIHPVAEAAGADAVPLVNRSGAIIANVTRRDWCNAAMEGTGSINTGGKRVVFNFVGLGSRQFTDCSVFFRRSRTDTLSNIKRSLFEDVTDKAPYGLGARNYKLVPFRTVAVDKRTIPLGSVLYIEALKGLSFRNEYGHNEIHDGYVFAGDTGNEIRNNHIDIFTGEQTSNPLPDIIRSTPSATFLASFSTNAQIIRALRARHAIR